MCKAVTADQEEVPEVAVREAERSKRPRGTGTVDLLTNLRDSCVPVQVR